MSEFRFASIKIPRVEDTRRLSEQKKCGCVSNHPFASGAEEMKMRQSSRGVGSLSSSKNPRAKCPYADMAATKSCAFSRYRFPTAARAKNFSECDLHKLNLAYIRAHRMAVWAFDYFFALYQLPPPILKDVMWANDKTHSPLTASGYFGPYTPVRLSQIVSVLSALVARFRFGNLLFESLSNSDYPCKESEVIQGIHKDKGHIGFCPSARAQDVPGYARIVMHEAMHKLIVGLDDQLLPNSDIKAYEDLALVLALNAPQLAVLNIDNYTRFAFRLIDSIEKKCILFSTPAFDYYKEMKVGDVTYSDSVYYHYLGESPWWKVKSTCCDP